MPDTQPPAMPKAPAQQILGAASPKATRYRRAYILTAVFGTATAFGLLLVLGLFDGPHLGAKARQQDAAVPSDQTPQFGTFPGYDEVTAPAHAAKSAAAAPPHKAGVPLTPVVATAAAARPLAPREQATAGPDAASQAAEKARQSPIFFTNTADRSAHDAGLAGSPGAAATPGYRPVPASFAGGLPPSAPPTGRAGLYGVSGGEKARDSGASLLL